MNLKKTEIGALPGQKDVPQLVLSDADLVACLEILLDRFILRMDDCEEDLPPKGQPDISPCDCEDCQADRKLIRQIRRILKCAKGNNKTGARGE